MAWDEDSLHRALARRGTPSSLAAPLGHDAAVLRAAPGRIVTCTDQVIAGVHFEDGCPARDVGRKAVGRVLSDLAATAARPVAVSVALTAPPEADEGYLLEVLRTIDRRGAEFGAPLVGGDLAQGPGPLLLAVHGIGLFEGRKTPPGRSRARPGEAVVLTGPVGGSILGRHLRIEPRVSAGRWLHERGATAMMDVSDGLAWDLYRLARAAGVGVDIEEVPVHRDARRLARQSGRPAAWHALHDGEDHELIATLPASRLPAILEEASREAPGLTVIGRVRGGGGDRLRVPAAALHAGGGEELVRWRPEEGGWRHGGS